MSTRVIWKRLSSASFLAKLIPAKPPPTTTTLRDALSIDLINMHESQPAFLSAAPYNPTITVPPQNRKQPGPARCCVKGADKRAGSVLYALKIHPPWQDASTSTQPEHCGNSPPLKAIKKQGSRSSPAY